MTYKPIGSDFDDFLESEGLLEEATNVAVKRVLVYQIVEEMKRQNLTKSKLAKMLNTSRPQVDRMLDINNTSITLSSMLKCAEVFGKRLQISFV